MAPCKADTEKVFITHRLKLLQHVYKLLFVRMILQEYCDFIVPIFL